MGECEAQVASLWVRHLGQSPQAGRSVDSGLPYGVGNVIFFDLF